MKHILNKDVERQQRLIMLMFRDDSWKSAKYISDTLGCNIKTLRQDIDYLTSTYEEVITCEYSKNLGYKFHLNTGHSVQEIFLDWINHSLFFSILTDVFYEKNKEDDDYFFNTYFISETTLKRQVALINYHLKEFGMSLSLSKMIFKVSDEFVARLFFGNREMEKRSIYDWDTEQVDNQRLAFDLIELLEIVYDVSLTTLQKNMVAYFVLCSVIRSSGNYFLEESRESQLMSIENCQELLYQFKHPALGRSCLDSQNQVNDTLLFLEMLFTRLKQCYDSNVAKDISDTLMETLSSKMKTNTTVFHKDLVTKDVAYVLFIKEYYPYRMSYINHRGYFNYVAIQLKYPIFFQAVMDSFSELPKEYAWISSYSSELINSFFRYWKASDYDFITKVNQVSIYLSTTLNENQAKLNQYLFEKMFQQKINIIGYEYNQTSFTVDKTNKLLNQADVIICNHQFYSDFTNVIVVDDIINDAKLYNINKTIDSIRKKRFKT
ncbi:helix-turn-helix domain-containing protein [Vagococcus sp. JNUCC 83]